MSKKPRLELFDNPYTARNYHITIKCPEFTSVCPRTGQPDFGEITIEYCPDKLCIELKSLKFYMQGYRNRGIFYEALTNEILEDLSRACRPRWMKVTSRFSPRGGITTEVAAEYPSSAPEVLRRTGNTDNIRLGPAPAGAGGRSRKSGSVRR